MNRDIMLKRIKKYLLTVKLNIQYDNEAGLFDINKHCENFYCGLLNLVYGYQLKNANIEEKNFDSVDLIDDISGIYFQVTSNKRSEKIKDTIDTNTNALMSIPNYIPNKAEYNGQEITLKHIIKK